MKTAENYSLNPTSSLVAFLKQIKKITWQQPDDMHKHVHIINTCIYQFAYCPLTLEQLTLILFEINIKNLIMSLSLSLSHALCPAMYYQKCHCHCFVCLCIGKNLCPKDSSGVFCACVFHSHPFSPGRELEYMGRLSDLSSSVCTSSETLPATASYLVTSESNRWKIIQHIVHRPLQYFFFYKCFSMKWEKSIFISFGCSTYQGRRAETNKCHTGYDNTSRLGQASVPHIHQNVTKHNFRWPCFGPLPTCKL